MRPTLTYMDVLSRKSRRSRAGNGSDDDSDDGPPPDPDEPAPAPAPKKEKKPAGDVKEVQVAVRKTGEQGVQFQGGLTAVRREMLMMIHAEEDEKWVDYEYCDGEVCSGILMLLATDDLGRLPSRMMLSRPFSPAVTNN